jgi:hypothetical protein
MNVGKQSNYFFLSEVSGSGVPNIQFLEVECKFERDLKKYTDGVYNGLGQFLILYFEIQNFKISL